MYKIYTLSLISEPEIVRYVGLTKRSLRQRLWQHTHYAKVSKNKRANWIGKHKGDILIKEIDFCNSVEEANKLEVNYIKLYKACGANLINGTDGGERTVYTNSKISSRNIPIIQYDLQGKTINTFESLTKASKSTGYSISVISQSLNTGSIVRNQYKFLNKGKKFTLNGSRNQSIIELTNTDTKQITLYFGTKQISKDLKVSSRTISRYLESKKSIKNIFNLKYLKRWHR